MTVGRVMSGQSHKLRKSCESLIGICAGMLADGELNEAQVRFLNLWLKDNQDITSAWPGEVIAMRLEQVLQDGTVTTEELTHLKETLQELTGGTLQNTGAACGLSSSLPVNDDRANPIIFDKKSFCFTGNFMFGTRSACERAITERGAEPSPRIHLQLDYLVIGTMISAEWANSTFGRKIEQAVDYQQRGCPMLIISEAQWLKHI